MPNRKTLILLLSVLTGYPFLSSGDTVTSKNGEILKGKVISQTSESIVFESPFTGTVTILRTNIALLEIEEPLETVEDEQQNDAFEQQLKEILAPIFEPADEAYDWIQLTSGEWLKGEIKAMYSYSLEFDSDELDLQEFDWEDISRIRTADEYSVRVDRDTTRVGKLAMKDETLTIDDGSSVTVGQYGLISIAPGTASELSNWTSKVTLSSSLRSGSTQQKDVSLRAVVQRRTAKRKFYMDFLSNYTETEGHITSNDYRLNAFFDSFLTRRVFLRPISIEYFSNPLQNVDNRYTLGASIGYYLIDNRKTTWDVSTGPAYQRAEFIDVLPGAMNVEEDPAWVLSSHWDTELTKKLDWNGTFNLQYTKASGGMTYHTITSLDYELTKSIDLDLSLLWDRIDDPIANELGETSNNDDIRITFGIGVEL